MKKIHRRDYISANSCSAVQDAGGGAMKSYMLKLLALSLITALISAIAFQHSTAAEDKAGAGVTVSEIRDNPDLYFGKTVTVSGEINRVYGPKAFMIGGEGFIFEDELLVLSSKPYPAIPTRKENQGFMEEDIVQVTGTVRNFVITEIERDIDWDLSNELEVDFENKPVLIVDSLKLTPRKTQAADNRTRDDGADRNTGTPVTISEIAESDEQDNLDKYQGKKVIVSGEVNEVHGSNAFIIGGDDFIFEDELLVVSSDPLSSFMERADDGGLKEGDIVQVTGTVQKYDPGKLNVNIDREMESELKEDYKNKPVIVVSDINISTRKSQAQ